jgi:hypothetical protein
VNNENRTSVEVRLLAIEVKALLDNHNNNKPCNKQNNNNSATPITNVNNNAVNDKAMNNNNSNSYNNKTITVSDDELIAKLHGLIDVLRSANNAYIDRQLLNASLDKILVKRQ